MNDAIAERLDALLAAAARAEPTYLDFLDDMLAQEAESKRRKRVLMGIQIAHFPTTKTLDDFDFKFQPSIYQMLVRELSTGHFVHNAENVSAPSSSSCLPGHERCVQQAALGRIAAEMLRLRPGDRANTRVFGAHDEVLQLRDPLARHESPGDRRRGEKLDGLAAVVVLKEVLVRRGAWGVPSALDADGPFDAG